MSTAPVVRPAPAAPWYCGLEPWFLPVALALWVVGNIGQHAWPGGFRTMWQLVAPLVVVLAMPKQWPARTLGFALLLAVPIFVMLAPLGWMGLMAQLGHPARGALHALALGDAAMLAAGVVLAWSAMTSRCRPEDLIGRIATAAAATLAMAWGAATFAPASAGISVATFTFGNLNDLLWMCAPALLGGAAWAVARSDRGSSNGVAFLLTMAAALGLLGWVACTAFHTQARIGVVVTAGVVAGFFVLRALWRAWPRVAMAVGAVALIAGLGLGWRVLGDADPLNERALAWSAFWHQGVAHLPFGAGAEPGLRLADEPSEAAQRIEAARLLVLHARNEFLQCFAAGGIIGCGILVAIAVAIGWRIARINDPAQRAAASAIGIGMLGAALSDSTLSHPVGLAWAGILIGVIARCPLTPKNRMQDLEKPAEEPAAAAGVASWRWRWWWQRRGEGAPGPRICAVPLALLAVAAAVVDWHAVMLTSESPAQDRVNALHATWQSEVVLSDQVGNQAVILDNLAYDNANGMSPDLDGLNAANAQLDAVVRQVGFTSAVMSSATISANLEAVLARAQLSALLAAIARSPGIPAYWVIAWRDVEAIGNLNGSEGSNLAILVRRRPFTMDGWEQLDALLGQRPDYIVHPPLDEIDPAMQKVMQLRWAQAYLRLRYLRGDPHMPTPDLTVEPKSVQAAADLFVQIVWTQARFGDWQQISTGLEHLVDAYGECPDVGRLVLRAQGDPRAGELPWALAMAPRLAYGFRHSPPADTLAGITTKAGATRVWPLLVAIFPDQTKRAQAAAPDKQEEDPLVEQMTRLWMVMQGQSQSQSQDQGQDQGQMQGQGP